MSSLDVRDGSQNGADETRPGRAVGPKEAHYNVRVLDRAFTLLRLLSDGTPRSLVDIAAEAQLTPSTTFRLLAALKSYKYVSRHAGTGEYSLGISCLELSRAYLSSSVSDLALPHLMALRDATRETIHLAVLDDMDVIYTHKEAGLHAIGLMSSRVGGRNPAYCTGVGKALLAYDPPELVRSRLADMELRPYTSTTIHDADALMRELAVIAERGYALDQGEHEAEVRCVAAPIFDAAGRAVAAVSVAGPEGRLDPLEANSDLIERTVATAREISLALGFHPDPRPPH